MCIIIDHCNIIICWLIFLATLASRNDNILWYYTTAKYKTYTAPTYSIIIIIIIARWPEQQNLGPYLKLVISRPRNATAPRLIEWSLHGFHHNKNDKKYGKRYLNRYCRALVQLRILLTIFYNECVEYRKNFFFFNAIVRTNVYISYFAQGLGRKSFVQFEVFWKTFQFHKVMSTTF